MGTWPNRIEAGLLEAPAGTEEIGAGVQLYSVDARQLWDNLAHGVRGVAQLLLGSAGLVLSGTAFATGTQMPAGSWLLRDTAGYLLYRLTTAAQDLEFVDTSGTCKIWAVPALRTDDLVDVGDADAASAALGGIRFIVQDALTAAPDYGLEIGEGSVTASSFTSFTETAGIRVPTGLHMVTIGGAQTITGAKTFQGAVDIEGALTIQDAGNDHDATIAVADLAAGRAYTIPEAGGNADFVMSAGAQSIAGVKTFSAVPVVPDGSWSYAKLQDVSATDKVLGRSTAGAGDVEEIACVAAGRVVLASSVALTNYFASSTVVGWADTSGAAVIRYVRIGNTVKVHFQLRGTSNGTTATFTVPFAAASIAYYGEVLYVKDNDVDQTSPGICLISSGGSTVTLYKTTAFGAWTNGNQKGAYGTIEYQTS